MIHKAIAKPVRIRVKSCGEEHSTLDSLKHAFCVEDLVPLVKDGRLSRWLNQQGEKELAEYVEMIDADKILASEKEYVELVCLFYEKEFGTQVSTIKSKNDIREFWKKDFDKWKTCYRSITLSIVQTDGAFASRLYETERSFMSDSEWKSTFETLKAKGSGAQVARALDSINQKQKNDNNAVENSVQTEGMRIRTLIPRTCTKIKMDPRLIGIRDVDGLLQWMGLDQLFEESGKPIDSYYCEQDNFDSIRIRTYVIKISPLFEFYNNAEKYFIDYIFRILCVGGAAGTKYTPDSKNPFNHQLLLYYSTLSPEANCYDELKRIDYQPAKEFLKYQKAKDDYFNMYPRRSNVPEEIESLNYITTKRGERVSPVWSGSGSRYARLSDWERKHYLLLFLTLQI